MIKLTKSEILETIDPIETPHGFPLSCVREWVEAQPDDAPEPFEVKVGVFYKSRDGRKIGPMVGKNFKWVEGFASFSDNDWRNDGTHRKDDMSADDDLVAEWVDDAPKDPPATWADMTPDQRAAIPQATLDDPTNPLRIPWAEWSDEGKKDVVWECHCNRDVEAMRDEEWVKTSLFLGLASQVAYRIPPAPPEIETRNAFIYAGDRIYHGTVTLIDGKPDLASIKWERDDV